MTFDYLDWFLFILLWISFKVYWFFIYPQNIWEKCSADDENWTTFSYRVLTIHIKWLLWCYDQVFLTTRKCVSFRKWSTKFTAFMLVADIYKWDEFFLYVMSSGDCGTEWMYVFICYLSLKGIKKIDMERNGGRGRERESELP